MSEAGHNVTTAAADVAFHCCCFITSADFHTNGTVGIHIFNSIILVLTSISAILGNLLVLVSIWRTPSLHSASNVLLFGLAVSDLGVGLLVEPIAFVYHIAKIRENAEVFCNSAVALAFSGALFCVASLLIVTAMSLDINIALYLHLRYHEIVTVKRMAGALVSIWLSSSILSLLYLKYWKLLTVVWISFILFCIFVTTWGYCKLFREVRRHELNIDNQQAQQFVRESEDPTSVAQQPRSLKNKMCIHLLFAFCYLPFTVLMATPRIGSYATKRTLFEMSLVLIYINSTLNPLVYCWRFKKIRVAVLQHVRRFLSLCYAVKLFT